MNILANSPQPERMSEANLLLSKLQMLAGMADELANKTAERMAPYFLDHNEPPELENEKPVPRPSYYEKTGEYCAVIENKLGEIAKIMKSVEL